MDDYDRDGFCDFDRDGFCDFDRDGFCDFGFRTPSRLLTLLTKFAEVLG